MECVLVCKVFCFDNVIMFKLVWRVYMIKVNRVLVSYLWVMYVKLFIV